MTNSSIAPAKYWRDSKEWPHLLGQTGVVIASSLVHSGLAELDPLSPYYLVLVKLSNAHNTLSTHLFLGASGYKFKTGMAVQCVLRRLSSSQNGLIHYGIKVVPKLLP